MAASIAAVFLCACALACASGETEVAKLRREVADARSEINRLRSAYAAVEKLASFRSAKPLLSAQLLAARVHRSCAAVTAVEALEGKGDRCTSTGRLGDVNGIKQNCNLARKTADAQKGLVDTICGGQQDTTVVKKQPQPQAKETPRFVSRGGCFVSSKAVENGNQDLNIMPEACKTCLPRARDDGIRRKAKRCTSCTGATTFLAVVRVDEDTGVQSGYCIDAAKLRLNREGVRCGYSKCLDAKTAKPPNQNTKRIVCSRVCMVGHKNTMTKLMRWKDSSKTEITRVDAAYQGFGDNSSPACLLHKVSLCDNLSPPGSKKESACLSCKNEKCRQQHCERCVVKKKVVCHAVAPTTSLGGNAIRNKQDFPITNFTDAMKDQCKHAISPCDSIGRFF